jgi:PAS domain S-box-containing protein
MDDGAAAAAVMPDGGLPERLAERLAALAAAAPGYEAGVEAMARAICDANNGRLCTLHRLGADGRALHLTGGYAVMAVGGDAQLETLRMRPADDPVLGVAVADRRQVVRLEGLSSLIATPLDVGRERCVLLFAGPPSAAATTRVLLADLVERLRPLLLDLRERERARIPALALAANAEAVLVTEAKAEDERIVYASPAIETLTGFTAEELIGTSPRLLRWLGAPGEGWQAVREAVRRQQPLRQEVIFRHRNGMPVWVDMSLAPMRDAAGRCTHFVSALRDITREREASASLHESEQAFRTLYERNPIPMWIYDQRTLGFVSVNDAAVEDYGWSRDDFLRMTLLDIQPPEDRRAASELATRPGRDRAVSGPWRHVTATGREKLVQTSAYLTEFGGRRAVLVAAWDVTAQVRFERELRVSRAALQRQAVELRHTQRLARLGTWRWPAGGGPPTWSEEVNGILGTDPQTPPPTRAATLALIHPDDRDALGAAIRRVAETGRQEGFEFRVVRPDGRVLHCRGEGYLEPGHDGAESAVAGYVQDVTEQREAEAALRQADRMATLGQLTGGIAHDFNNLLTVASVSLEMAAEAAAQGRAEPDLIGSARAALERGSRLTSQLLSFARRQPLQPQALDLARVLPGLIELMQRSIGERHPIRLQPEGRPAVSADPAQLEAALLNLVLNARDAMPDGGAIAVRTRLVEVEPGIAGLARELAPGRYASIAVADTGTGIPAEVQARIFEPFFTTKPAGVGTGLGLSMVLGFAKQSGGHVSAESIPGQGTTMTLYLPAVETGGEALARAEAEDAPLPVQLDVLVVEDRPDVRVAAVRMCTAVGLQPMAVGSAEEALQVLRSGMQFDALFTDTVLGGPMDGLELAAAALALQPGLAVVCTSGTMNDEIGRRGREVVGVEMLPKPYDSRSFQAALMRALTNAKVVGG